MKIKYDISKGSLWKVGSAARSNQGGLTKSTMQDIMAGKAVDLDNNFKNSLNLEAVTVQEVKKVVKKAEEPKAKKEGVNPKDASTLSADKKPKNKN